MDAKSLVVFAHKKVGLEVLKFLLERQYCIKALIIADDKQVEIENLALKWGIKFRIFNSNNLMDFLKSLGKIEWLVNAWSPHYLPKEILNLFTYRLNIHPSYAPYCLGNDNAAWAIMENRADPAGGGLYSRCMFIGNDRAY